jgi:hypothetical protein
MRALTIRLDGDSGGSERSRPEAAMRQLGGQTH